MILESMKYFLKFKTFNDTLYFKNNDTIFGFSINTKSIIDKDFKIIVINIIIHGMDGKYSNSLDVKLSNISIKSGFLKLGKLSYEGLINISSEEYLDIKCEVLNKIEEIRKQDRYEKEIARQEELKKCIELVSNIDPYVEVINYGTLFTKLLKNTFNKLKHPTYNIKDGKFTIHSVIIDSDFNINHPAPNNPQVESAMSCYINDLIGYNVSLDINYLKEINKLIPNK